MDRGDIQAGCCKEVVGPVRSSPATEITPYTPSLEKENHTGTILASQALHSRKCNAHVWDGELKIWRLGLPMRCWEMLYANHPKAGLRCLTASLLQGCLLEEPASPWASLLPCPGISDTSAALCFCTRGKDPAEEQRVWKDMSS